jgi:RNA polymerase sigma factor (sigma-70 family)
VDLDAATLPAADQSTDLIALDEALRRLAEIDEQKAQVVELRFFAGCSIEDAAKALDISTATVERDWRFARAWLRTELSDEDHA